MTALPRLRPPLTVRAGLTVLLDLDVDLPFPVRVGLDALV
jgi:hypothetical protein